MKKIVGISMILIAIFILTASVSVLAEGGKIVLDRILEFFLGTLLGIIGIFIVFFLMKKGNELINDK